jgi:ribosomal protein S19E (S16A)
MPGLALHSFTVKQAKLALHAYYLNLMAVAQRVGTRKFVGVELISYGFTKNRSFRRESAFPAYRIIRRRIE